MRLHTLPGGSVARFTREETEAGSCAGVGLGGPRGFSGELCFSPADLGSGTTRLAGGFPLVHPPPEMVSQCGVCVPLPFSGEELPRGPPKATSVGKGEALEMFQQWAQGLTLNVLFQDARHDARSGEGARVLGRENRTERSWPQESQRLAGHREAGGRSCSDSSLWSGCQGGR